ncbi:SAM-dependent chlorinase/fluorinase [Salarchaeum sp. III]|uniref:SAM hydrolase/SAM-dependent halogenase family protein n=1 Tax=Salarchaeum sp. III TaxID=3107927 RepID=UPI002ED973E1
MITLTSDFGSPYPAAMKGVALQRTDARLVDIAHDLPRQDVRAAAFWLREVVPYYPPAVHLVVVDPGVGTERAAIVVRVGDHAFVAPDNGVVRPAARALDGDIEAFEIDDSDAASSTFHGRDVFAPAAGDVHEAGVENIEDIDGVTPVDDCVDLALPDATIEDDTAHGEVLVVDDFGNAITNIPGEFVADAATVLVNGERAPVEPSYAHVAVRERLVTVASHENVELAVNQGRGVDAFGVRPGDSVDVER